MRACLDKGVLDLVPPSKFRLYHCKRRFALKLHSSHIQMKQRMGRHQ